MMLFTRNSLIGFVSFVIIVCCFLGCQNNQAVPVRLATSTTQTSDQSTPNTFYKYAYAFRDCAPWDGAAVSIFLTDQPIEKDEVDEPYLSIVIYKNLSALAGNTFKIENGSTHGGTSIFCPTKKGKCQVIESGTVEIKSVSPEKVIEGEYQLKLEGNIKKIGSFKAIWVSKTVLCG